MHPVARSCANRSCLPAGRPVVSGKLPLVGASGGLLVGIAGGGCVSAWGGCFGCGLLGGAVVIGGLGGASVGLIGWGCSGVVVAGCVCLFMVSAYHAGVVAVKGCVAGVLGSWKGTGLALLALHKHV